MPRPRWTFEGHKKPRAATVPASAPADPNDAVRRKHFHGLPGRAYGTVRASLQRFEQLGYIEPNQRIGRSELYVPTPAMKRAVNDFAKKFWPHIQKVRNQSARVKDPA